jgi:hypothetical protein
MCNCSGRIHTFVCYLRNIATDMNRSAMNAGRALNAR